MKDLNSEPRRLGRGSGGFSRRVRQGYLQGLSDVWSWDLGAVCEPDHREGEGRTLSKSRQRNRTNWRVSVEGGEVIAVEPNRDFEHVFQGGPDPFMEALEFAAERLRNGG